MLLRGFVWLLALWAFALPPVVMPAVAHASSTSAAMSDCPFHAPPPEHCPDKSPAKHHMGGLCCLTMLHAIALLPEADQAAGHVVTSGPIAPAVRDLVGISLDKELPPPRA